MLIGYSVSTIGVRYNVRDCTQCNESTPRDVFLNVPLNLSCTDTVCSPGTINRLNRIQSMRIDGLNRSLFAGTMND